MIAAVPGGSDVAQEYLEAAASKMLVVRHTLREQAQKSIHDYLGDVTGFAERGCQGREDLISIIGEYASEHLGEATGRRVRLELAETPVVLTANHHGVDFFAQSIQSSLLFGLRKRAGAPAETVPVLACASVPLNNLTYPRGALIYRARPPGGASRPLKLPLFPDRYKREMVCRAAALDADMIERAVARADRMLRDRNIDADIHAALLTVLEEDYASAEVLAQTCYSDQAVLLNHRIWQRLFQATTPRPELVYLELERIASAVVALDAVNPDSLLAVLLFEPDNCQRLLAELDGERACWNRAELCMLAGGERAGASHGTVFFWGISDRGQRVPMHLVDDCLVSSLAGDSCIELSWDPESVVQAIHRGVLLPSLFTSYLAIGIARGVTCLGGYYQAEYLPIMQRAMTSVLRQSARHKDLSGAVERVPTTAYLSGMQTVMTQLQEDILVPAGALEIIAGGGLSETNVRNIGRLTVHQTHLASVIDTVMDLAPELASTNWHTEVGSQLHKTLRGSLVLMNECSP